METNASSGRTKQLFHRKSIVTLDAIEHVLIVANSYLAYWPRRPTTRTARRRAVLDWVACAILIHTFVSVAGRAAVRRCAWLDRYIAMRLFQSLDASPLAPREFSHRRMSRGQAFNEQWRVSNTAYLTNPYWARVVCYVLLMCNP
jgi:hypothetical protein